MPAKQRTPQRASTMLDRLAARSLAPVPDIPTAPAAAAAPVEPEPAAPAAAPKPATPRKNAPAMPAEQQHRTRKATAPAAGDQAGTFPHRITQTMSYEQSDALDEIRKEQNKRLRGAGHEQVYTVTGLIRAAVDVCLSDPKLTARMVKAAGEPRLSGRGGIGTRR